MHGNLDVYKRQVHRQALARMILENGWYESKTGQNSGWFKDAPSGSSKEMCIRDRNYTGVRIQS